MDDENDEPILPPNFAEEVFRRAMQLVVRRLEEYGELDAALEREFLRHVPWLEGIGIVRAKDV